MLSDTCFLQGLYFRPEDDRRKFVQERFSSPMIKKRQDARGSTKTWSMEGPKELNQKDSRTLSSYTHKKLKGRMNFSLRDKEA